jgi:hypothetical protein
MRECSSASLQQKFLPELRYVNGRTASDNAEFIVRPSIPLSGGKAGIGQTCGKSSNDPSGHGLGEVTEQSPGPKVFGSAVVFWTQFLYPNEMAGDDL